MSESLYTPVPTVKAGIKFERLETASEGFSLNPYSSFMVDTFASNKPKNDSSSEVFLAFPILIIMITMVSIVFIICVCSFYLRSVGKCGLNRTTRDSKSRKIIRCLLWLLILLVVIVIGYGLYVCILGSIGLSKYSESSTDRDKNPKRRQIDHVIIKNFQEFERYVDREAQVLAHNNINSIHNQCKVDVDEPCWIKTNMQTIKKLMNDMSKDIDELTCDIMEWSDYMRFFHRTMTRLLHPTTGGRQAMNESNFVHFYVRALQIDTLIAIRAVMGNLKFIISELDDRYVRGKQIPKNFDRNIKDILTYYLNNVSQSLSHKGKGYRDWSENVVKPVKLHRKQHTSTLSKQNEPLTKLAKQENQQNEDSKVTHILIFLIVMPVIYALVIIGLIILICGLYLEIQDNGLAPLLSLISLYVIFILYLIVGVVAICTLYFTLVGDHTKCSQSSKLRTHAALSSFCQPGKSVKEILDYQGPVKYNTTNVPNPNIQDLAAALSRRMRNMAHDGGHEDGIGNGNGNMLSNSTIIKERAKLENYFMKDGPLCSEIVNRVNKTFLRQVYEEIYKYASADMPNVQSSRNMAICNLNRFKTSRIDSFEKSRLFKKAQHFNRMCQQLADILDKGIEKPVVDCMDALDKMEMCYRGDYDGILRSATDGIDNLYEVELIGYNDYLANTLEFVIGACRLVDTSSQSTNCKDYYKMLYCIWSGLFLIMVALLLIIFISLCLEMVCRSGGAWHSDENEKQSSRTLIKATDMHKGSMHTQPKSRFSVSVADGKTITKVDGGAAALAAVLHSKQERCKPMDKPYSGATCSCCGRDIIAPENHRICKCKSEVNSKPVKKAKRKPEPVEPPRCSHNKTSRKAAQKSLRATNRTPVHETIRKCCRSEPKPHTAFKAKHRRLESSECPKRPPPRPCEPPPKRKKIKKKKER